MKLFFQLYFDVDHIKFQMIFSQIYSHFISLCYYFIRGTVTKVRTQYSTLNVNSRLLNLALHLELHNNNLSVPFMF